MSLTLTNTVDTLSEEDKRLAAIYQEKDELQHILDRPDTEIGSIEQVSVNMWIYPDTESPELISETKSNKIVKKNIQYIPGLFKLFDEVIVNCRDHVVRMNSYLSVSKPNCLPVTKISVDVDQATGTITMMNDGSGIDVAMHPINKIWIPELIFGHLRTSTNYEDDKKGGPKTKDEKTAWLNTMMAEEGTKFGLWGGKNGKGIKLVFIWSTFGSVETVDHVRGLKFYQEFRNNLSEIGGPVITKVSKTKDKPYTKIVFCPDYARLQLDSGLSADIMSLMKKRVYDISAVTDNTIKVKFNGDLVPTKNFSQYIDLYIGDKTASPRVYEQASNNRWEYAVASSPNAEFMQISFVNGISTHMGGTHVNNIMNQITNKLKKYIELKKKKIVKVSSIKEQLILFLRCDILFPSFNSQSKDYLNNADFGSSCIVSDAFIEKVAKMGVMDLACAISEAKNIVNEKKTDGSKRKRITGIPKLEDANWAGTAKSYLCTLCLTEGDSAHSALLSGMSPEDRNTHGLFPLKGKLENIREKVTTAKEKDKDKNQKMGEIESIKKIMGLAEGKQYLTIEDVNRDLRYSRVMLVTDQDPDGSHIKGLSVNFFHYKWPSLTKLKGFICFMNTPILTATKGKQVLVFYNQGEHNLWKLSLLQNQCQSQAWAVKYYKGLGTSTKKEFQEYMRNPKIVVFDHSGQVCDDSIDMMFNKKRADDRKVLIQNYNPESYLNTSDKSVSYTNFVQKELLAFSVADCVRSIPNVLDGLKPSQRKVLFSCIKRNLKNELKVAQLAGYVSEHSAYHHGEMSLTMTIVNMAQNYMGSNNINLLFPAGQFGTRLKGGKDHASARYIFTRLEAVTSSMFMADDNPLLTYMEDDGNKIEPQYYGPTAPLLLINGSSGIGTGYSTDIPCYNPIEVFGFLKDYLQSKINSTLKHIPTTFLQDNADRIWVPYYHGFRGTVVQTTSPNNFMCKGVYEKTSDDTIHLTELPIGVWTADFKVHMETLEFNGIIKTYTSMSNDTIISFIITFPSADTVATTISTAKELKAKELKAKKLNAKELNAKELSKTTKSSDMPILRTLAELEQTPAKNQPQCNELEHLLKLYTNITTTNMVAYDQNNELQYYTVAKIFQEFIPVKEELYVRRKANIVAVLKEQLLKLSNQAKFIKELYADLVDLRKKKPAQVTEMMMERGYDFVDGGFNYLTKMNMDSVTEEHGQAILDKCKQKKAELVLVENTSCDQMWMADLINLEKVYAEYVVERNEASASTNTETKPTKVKSKAK